MAERIFLERRSLYQFVAREKAAAQLTERSERLGLSEETPREGGSEHAYVAGVAAVRDRLVHWPASVAQAVERLLDEPSPVERELDRARALCTELCAIAGERGIPGARVVVYRSWQNVVVGEPARLRHDERTMLVVEVSGISKINGYAWECWRALSFRHWEDLSRERIDETLAEIAGVLSEGAPGVPCPKGRFPVVFPPGAASGSFFHEVCGHPLEGDVVARGGSYLARRRGEPVAAEFVTISDDPSKGHGCTYAIDDQGAESARVPLIDRGRIAGPLLDRDSAHALGRAANGHGRRVDFRHPPLPRMAHTQLEPHEGTFASLVDAVGEGILLQHLTPRHVNLLTGEFSFFINEGRWVEKGKVQRMIGPGVLRGRGDEALRSIVAVGADYRPLFSVRGCRKLDHGPLHVSFGQPSIRFSGLVVEPWY